MRNRVILAEDLAKAIVFGLMSEVTITKLFPASDLSRSFTLKWFAFDQE